MRLESRTILTGRLMRSFARHTTFLLAAIVGLAETSGAQDRVASASPPPLPANDSMFRRARRLVSDGNGAAGRALVDSLLRASREGAPTFGNALFWRGALAETAADAERDYRRVIVEYPLSPYSDDALLSLAELEQARGDRTAAYQHLVRFVREHPVSPARARAGLAAARLAFEQRDTARGCAMITDARASVGSADVELRNQIEHHGARCPTVSAVPAPPQPAAARPPAVNERSVRPTAPATPTPTPTPTSTPTATPSKTTATPPPAPPAAKPNPALAVSRVEPAAARPLTSAPRGSWTIQLAAYNTRADAERLVAKLAGRGVKARVSGEAKPFRVRLDFYPSHQDAVAAVASLKQRGIIGFATEEPRPTGAQAP